MYVTIASLESKVLKYILRWVIWSMPVNFKRIFKKNKKLSLVFKLV